MSERIEWDPKQEARLWLKTRGLQRDGYQGECDVSGLAGMFEAFSERGIAIGKSGRTAGRKIVDRIDGAEPE